jgi:aspartyl-tRNA(Asn)/glutamyl-tRNA(Gln) amidotransferase subunit B
MYEQYETVVGLEIHIQLGTHSKAFCGDSATFGGNPNTHISAISLAHPGTLPRMNKTQIEYAIRLGLAMDSSISLRNAFDRKNYFYADLPKGYQITQDRLPICIGGGIDVLVNGVKKHIRLHHIHMEEDAGKSTHDHDPNYSLIDLNRAGVPLLEVVSEPDMRSSDEVYEYIAAMRQLVRYLGISDANMEEGSMRCDCNVSVMKKGAIQFGNRCEIKNINSLRFAKRAIDYEAKRQIDLIESGGKVTQQTRSFDPVTGTTAPLRDKEDAHDYRYFPDPDLPPIVLKAEDIMKIKATLPPMPWELRAEFIKKGISIEDTHVLTEDKTTALYCLDLIKAAGNGKAVANLVLNKIRPFGKEKGVEIHETPISTARMVELLQLIESGKVASTVAYQRIFPEMWENNKETPLAIAQRFNLIQDSDTDFLSDIITKVLAQYPDKVADYKKGKKNLIGLFMGEVMKQSGGKADPKTTTQLLQKALS